MTWLVSRSISSPTVVPFLCHETVVTGPPSLRQVRVNSGGLTSGSVWRVKDMEADVS